ncbi:hypothetical protein lerEdw1_002975 [Lerista edwardsae]|nr:hypothetical protein lerEdw1_002975 [Lerista edwardsae]
MKVFALMILVVSVCSLEGALVKRETDPIPPQLTEVVQKIQEYVNSAHAYVTTELAQQEKLEQLKAQAQTYLQSLREHVDPVTTRVREGLTEFVSGFLKVAQAYAPKPVANS